MSAEALILSAPAADVRESPALGNDRPAEVNGQPAKYVWKPLVKAGKYVHPNPRVGQFELTRDDLAAADKHTRDWMRQEGGRPYVPASHTATDARDNLGWITETKLEGDTLWGLHQLIGEDAHRAAARNESSVCLKRNYQSGSGRVYPWLLEHNALTPAPVVTGLGGFVSLSRDGGGEMAPVFQLAAHQEPDMDLSELRKALGADDSVADADLVKLAAERVAGIPAAVDAAKAEVRTELSRKYEPAKPTAREVYYAGQALDAKRRDVLAAGVSEGTVKAIEARILPREVKYEALSLSRAPEDGDGLLLSAMDTLSAVYDGLKNFKPAPKAGEQTGAQVLDLSRQVPGAEGQQTDYAKVAAETAAKVLAERYGHHAAPAK